MNVTLGVELIEARLHSEVQVVSTGMGDHQGRPGSVNLGPFVVVDLTM